MRHALTPQLSDLPSPGQPRSKPPGTPSAPPTSEEDRSPVEPRPVRVRPRIGIAVVSFLAVMAVGASLFVNRDGSPAADSPLDVASGYMTAIQDWDAETTLELLAEDAVVEGGPVSSVEELPNQLAWMRALDWRWVPGECTASEDQPVTQVTCSFVHENMLSRSLGVGPFEGSTMDLEIADGLVQRSTQRLDITEYSPQVFEVFRNWLNTNYPQDVVVLFADGCCWADVSPESVALWAERAEEFAAEQTASG